MPRGSGGNRWRGNGKGTRPCPPEFRHVYLTGGWPAVELEFGARPSVIRRWIAENGGDQLIQARMKVKRCGRWRAKHPASVETTITIEEKDT